MRAVQSGCINPTDPKSAGMGNQSAFKQIQDWEPPGGINKASQSQEIIGHKIKQ